MHSGKNLLLYLGRKGGGLQLFTELEFLNCARDSISIGPTMISNSKYTFSTRWHKSTFTIPLVSIYSTFLIIRKRKNFSRLVIPMTSWADLLPSFVSLVLRKEVSRVIHDLQIHPGDPTHQVVPLKIQILLSTNLMTLSNYVKQNLTSVTAKPIIYLGMYFPKKLSISEPRVISQVIFFGRLSKYKGASLLLQTLDGVSRKLKIVIAGQGEIPIALAEKADVLVNRFLSDEELINFLSQTDIAIFPYIEGSQSGAMALAATYGCKIVGTNVGGIAEFGTNLEGFWFSEPDANSLRRALEDAIDSTARPQITGEMRAQFFRNIGM